LSLIDSLLSNPDLARVLCIAVATEAGKTDEPVNAADLAKSFSRITRSLDRGVFTDECRKLQRMGSKRYLQAAKRLLS